MGDAGEAERERFEAVFKANARPVLGYALRRVTEPTDAADVVAETFLVAWRRIDDVPRGDEARPWLLGVARRVLANQRRGQLRRNRLGEAIATQLSQELEFDKSRATAQAQLVASALRRLDDRDRELLQLSVWEGLTPSQMAKTISIPAVTVRSRLHRARRRLRREMEELERRERVELSGADRTDKEEAARDRRERA
jgi:RNA polymerase sigma-70 factor (ECF subfamily)